MILHVILILIILKLSGCSLVLDAMSQNTLYVSSYCPAMKNCIEGSHVICQYYNHRRPVGELCHKYVKVSITSQMVQKILEEVNKIRMKLATGEETGKDSRPLPRAYGMMKMHWDSELATLAQVLADQCLGLKEDDCRVTDKFPNPSQIITMINFNTPNWEYLNKKSKENGLTNEKIMYSIEKAFKSLHTIKRLINANDINFYPALERRPDKGSRSYLKLIRGKATHIGCGISAYTRAQILSSGSQHIYNSIQLVCNVSDGPLQEEPVYTTEPPVPNTGFTDKCGCPEGYSDSTGCLCEKHTRGNIENKEIQWRHFNLNNDNRGHSQGYETERCDESNEICDASNVVVLPIFEIQDAPESSDNPESDAEKQFDRRFGNTSFTPLSMEESDIADSKVNPEIQSVFRRHAYRRGASGAERKKTYDNVPISNEETAEPFLYESRAVMENNIAEHDPRQNSGHYDRSEEESPFLEILEILENAMQNIKLEGAERDIFDFKMRKIYEAALKSKLIRGSNELEDEFQKLTDYLRSKSDATMKDESVQSDDIFDLKSPRGNDEDTFINDIDEKLLDILIKKHHHKDDYFSKHSRKRGLNIINDAYTYPPSRKQEKINNNDNNLIKSNKLKRTLDIRNHKSLRPPVSKQQMPQYEDDRKLIKKKINYERRREMAVNKRKMGIFNNLDHDVKTFVRRPYSYPGHKKRKSWNSPVLRKVFGTENERPTLPMTTQKTAKVKLQLVSKKRKQYLKKDRPIL